MSDSGPQQRAGQSHPGNQPPPTGELLDRLAEVCQITPPREPGLDVVGTVQAMPAGRVKVFLGMGGNFALATPDTAYSFAAMRRCDLTMHVSTKLNRSHLVHGQQALILPCLARSERDQQAAGLQGITVEDSMSMVHLSRGKKDPASPHLRSECAIIGGLAQATLPETSTPWAALVGNYDLIRDRIAATLDGFEDFNNRVLQPMGSGSGNRPASASSSPRVARPSSRRERWRMSCPTSGRLMLSTMRSHDQFNTTIYSNDDRYRGIKNLRTLLLMNEADMRERGLREFDRIDITSIARDDTRRTVHGYLAVTYDIPAGSVMGYMPELNVLCPIEDYSPESRQPVMKHVVVEVKKEETR